MEEFPWQQVAGQQIVCEEKEEAAAAAAALDLVEGCYIHTLHKVFKLYDLLNEVVHWHFGVLHRTQNAQLHDAKCKRIELTWSEILIHY